MEIVEREAKIATGQSGMYFRISMGPHHVVVMYSSVRLDRYGVIALIEVETLNVELLFVSIDQKKAQILISDFHYTTNCYCPDSNMHFLFCHRQCGREWLQMPPSRFVPLTWMESGNQCWSVITAIALSLFKSRSPPNTTCGLLQVSLRRVVADATR